MVSPVLGDIYLNCLKVKEKEKRGSKEIKIKRVSNRDMKGIQEELQKEIRVRWHVRAEDTFR
jgi:hypothetical protein